jgi:hypothetical protein
MSNKSPGSLKWNCLFRSETSAFFLNYVLQSAFVGNTLEIMRVPELSLYILCNLFISRSVPEYESARQNIYFTFSFGTKYPRFLLILTIVIVYSFASPLIAPCGKS